MGESVSNAADNLAAKIEPESQKSLGQKAADGAHDLKTDASNHLNKARNDSEKIEKSGESYLNTALAEGQAYLDSAKKEGAHLLDTAKDLVNQATEYIQNQTGTTTAGTTTAGTTTTGSTVGSTTTTNPPK